MIRFSLSCDNGHAFDGWFASNADFDDQCEKALVQCPQCGSAHVTKSLMAPAVAKAGSGSSETASPARETMPLAMSAEQKSAMAKLREMARRVKANADDVGERFPEEARRIHYGEARERGIFGRASLDDARALVDEGISIAPLPDFSEDAN